MTSLLNDILNAIGKTDRDNLQIKHSFIHFSCKGCLNSPNKNLGIELQNIFNHLLLSELFIVVELKNGIQDPIRFSSNSINKFDERASAFFDNYDESEKTYFEIESEEWKNINIFHASSFIDYLSERNIEENLNSWSNYFNENHIIINLYDDFETHNNDYVFIHSVYPNSDTQQLNDWKNSQMDNNKLINNQIERRDRVSHFVNAVQINFIPECFYFKKDFFLKSHFDYLRSIFVLVFLSDYTNIDKSIFKFKIKGYKTLSCKLNAELPDTVNNELFNIYKWVYGEGSFIDKIGIARNVLSIHITNEDISTLEDGTCCSAQSGYDIYLKDNVKQYIEIKNKIADMLYNQSEKASGIVKDMFTKFKTSIWTLFSFFILSFLSKAYTKTSVSTPTLDSVFFDDSAFVLSFTSKTSEKTKIIDILCLDVSVICIAILIIIFSFCYLWFAKCEINDEIKRLEYKYTEIENRYKDLLNEKDLDKILKQSNVDEKSPREREIDYIKNKKKLYTIWWMSINGFLSFLIFISIVINLLS